MNLDDLLFGLIRAEVPSTSSIFSENSSLGFDISLGKCKGNVGVLSGSFSEISELDKSLKSNSDNEGYVCVFLDSFLYDFGGNGGGD